MSVTMSYRPYRSQNRVEFIKKKFESSFLENNNTGSLKETNSKADFLQELRDLNLEKKLILREETGFEKNEGKVSVKRCPAFRREKLLNAKSSSEIYFQKSDTFLKRLNENAQKEDLKTKACDVNTRTDFKRSKTDTNLLKYCSNKSLEKRISPDNSNNSLSFSLSSDSKCDANEKILAQYSAVESTSKNNAVNLKFTDSIRRALQSPLPKGPPPKKPPRTFATQNSTVKTDIPKLKSKLEKLEKVVKIHESGTPLDKMKNSFDKKLIQRSSKKDSCSMPNVTEPYQSCLPISTCLNHGSKVPNVKKLLKAKSEFYLGMLNTKDSEKKKDCTVEICNEPPLKISSSEVVYDLPCVNKKNSFETFGKSRKDSKESLNSKNTEGLHYMCTDVINHTPKHLNFPSNIEWRKTPGSETQAGPFGAHEDKMELNSMNRADDGVERPANVLKSESESVKRKKNLNCAGFEESSEDSDFDSFSKVAGEWITVDSNECSFEPVTSSRTSCNNPPFRLSGQLKDHVLGNSTSVKKNPTRTCRDVLQKERRYTCKTCCVPLHLDLSEMNKKEINIDEEVLLETTAKRKIYVSRVSSQLMSQVPCWKYKSKNNYKHLFECCLLVGLTLCESKQNVPYIKSIFPPDTKPPPLIESLCFPDASYWPPTSESHQPDEQYYSLVVTNENGERKFGYCRRVLPEGGHVCLPLTYCIISPHRAGGFFYKVLEELESRHGSPGVENFIKQLYESEFPRPGQRLRLKEILEEATRTTRLNSALYLSSTLVRRPPDARLEENDLTKLFQCLQLPVVLKVFSSLLHERKVLLLSNSLRILSSCSEALQSILLPFSWQHTYIPVLPVHLIEMCEAPTPYVIGLLKPRNIEKSLTNISFEDGILVDLDDSKILKCCGDEGTILPARVTGDLKTSLSLAMNVDELSESVQSVIISDAFIRFFVQLCGNYPKFIQSTANGEKIFQKENFIKSAPSNTMQSFLDWFTETAMFNSFIQERLQGDDEDALLKLFRRRALEYTQETAKDSAVLLKNYKVINKKVRTLGDKIKDLTSFSK